MFCCYLDDALPLHLNFLLVQRALYFVPVWSDVSQMVCLAVKVKWRCGMALNSSPVPQDSLDVWFSLLLELMKNKESSLFRVVLTDYTYWNLHFWFHFLWDSSVAQDLQKYPMIFENHIGCYLTVFLCLSWQIIYLLSSSFLPCYVVIALDWPYLSEP